MRGAVCQRILRRKCNKARRNKKQHEQRHIGEHREHVPSMITNTSEKQNSQWGRRSKKSGSLDGRAAQKDNEANALGRSRVIKFYKTYTSR